MNFERISDTPTEPFVTLGCSTGVLTFSKYLLRVHDPKNTGRVSVFIDKTEDAKTARIGFSFRKSGDLKISTVNQVRCPRISRELRLSNTIKRYAAVSVIGNSVVDCYIEVPYAKEEV